jgi:hypothetical protein
MSGNLTQVRYFEFHPSKDAPFVQLSKTGKIFVAVSSISTSLLELAFLQRRMYRFAVGTRTIF